MNKEEYKDINILIPDICEYMYILLYEHEMVKQQTIKIINKISEENRNGKYIIPCLWLEDKHQVNLMVDFDNKICEIVNTGRRIDKRAINKLQEELRTEFWGKIKTKNLKNC